MTVIVTNKATATKKVEKPKKEEKAEPKKEEK